MVTLAVLGAASGTQPIANKRANVGYLDDSAVNAKLRNGPLESLPTHTNANNPNEVRITAQNLTLNVTEPADDAIWQQGTACNISWNVTGGTTPYNISILCSTAGAGGPFSVITSDISTNGTYQWTPVMQGDIWWKILVNDSSSPSQTDFVIRHVTVLAISQLSVSITGPANRTMWQAGGTYQINWTGSGGTGSLTVNLTYSTAFPYQISGTIKDGLTANGTYSWKLPITIIGGLLTINATITDSLQNTAQDSRHVIVLPDYIVVITPTFANLTIGQTQDFSALAYNYNIQNGSRTPITSGFIYTFNLTSVDGIVRGSLHSTGSNTTRFTATQVGNCNINCIGVQIFTFKTGLGTSFVNITVHHQQKTIVNLTSPNGRERYARGGECNITWNIISNATISPYSIQLMYSKDGGQTYTHNIANLTQDSPGIGHFIWQLPLGISETGNRVRLGVTDNTSIYASDESNSNFSVAVSSHIGVFYGYGSQGIVNRDTLQLTAQITDDSDFPCAGVPVEWIIKSVPRGATGQNLTTGPETTDNLGTAQAFIRLGNICGAYNVSAASSLVPGKLANFTVYALPDVPENISIQPSEIVLNVGTIEDFSASIFDAYGNAVANMTVQWGVEGGIGTVANGTFTATAEGTGNVTATCGAAMSRAQIEVTVLPTIDFSIPSDRAVNVPVNSSIMVKFSRAMNETSVFQALNITPVVITNVTWLGNEMQATPNGGFMLGMAYTVKIVASCTDMNGNHLDGNENGKCDAMPIDDYVFTFTTVSQNRTQPTIVSYSPTGTTVSTDTVIYINFSKLMDTRSTDSSFSLSYSGSPVQGVFSWAVGNSTMEFRPARPLSYNTQYRVRINATLAKDSYGNPLNLTVMTRTGSGTFIWEFITGPGPVSSSSGNIWQYTAFAIFVIILVVLGLLIVSRKNAQKSKKPGHQKKKELRTSKTDPAPENDDRGRPETEKNIGNAETSHPKNQTKSKITKGG